MHFLAKIRPHGRLRITNTEIKFRRQERTFPWAQEASYVTKKKRDNITDSIKNTIKDDFYGQYQGQSPVRQ